jgi:malonyl-CoA O-methyltransferase
MHDEKTVVQVSTREGYDRWAAIYDDEPNPTTWLDARELPALWPTLAGRRVIELGCGTGRVLGPLRERGAIVTGVDFAPGMLAKAAAKHPDVELVLHDLSAPPLPFAEASFDVVVSSLVLEHIADLASFFAEARRLCRPGGTMALSTMHPALFLRSIQAHFYDRERAEEVRFESFPHQVGAIVMAALDAGWRLERIVERIVDEALGGQHPKLGKFVGWPLWLGLRLRRDPEAVP